jgi:diguanylate cyclase (GGDEF)-like protein
MVTAALLLDEPSTPTRRALVGWAVVGTAYLAVSIAVATRAGEPLRHLPWVAVAHAVSLSIIAGVTALLLYAHALRSGGCGYLALTSMFATVTLLQLAVPLTFPGAFVDGQILGSDQSSISIFYLWHLVFLLGLPISAVLLRRDAHGARRAEPLGGAANPFVVGLLPGLVLVAWVTLLPGLLPRLTGTVGTTPLATILDALLLLIAVTGLVVVVAATRGATAIGRWLIAVATLGVGEAIVNLGAERFSLGWYFNRSLGLLMMSLLLLALVWEVARVERSAYAVAARDSLTGASSRAVFETDLEREVEHALAGHQSLALLCLDLDRFKAVNDAHGHAVGDALLVDAVRRVLRLVRASDHVARMGGDEFVVLLTGVESRAVAELVAERIVDRLALPFAVGDLVVDASCSVGLSFLPQDAHTSDELLQHADEAMYAAKLAGGNRWCCFDERRPSGPSVPRPRTPDRRGAAGNPHDSVDGAGVA